MELSTRSHKRKPDSQDNERLSKRLSLLNIEKNGSKLYVPVEAPSIAPSNHDDSAPSPNRGGDDLMRVDDAKHKVYIYNIDDELSSDSETDEGKLVFLPDIEKHLKLNRIPKSLLLRDDTESEGKELVVYSEPKSLSIPEYKDSVRKVIIESRRRIREDRRRAAAEEATASSNERTDRTADDAMDID